MTNHVHESLGDVVTRLPASARLFDRLGLDYCCHGSRSVEDACADAGVDPDEVLAALDELGPPAPADWASLSPSALTRHLVETHHAYLRDELPSLSALVAKVHAVHGARHAELAEVRTLVTALRAELEPHLDKEELVLFPAIRAIMDDGRRNFPFGSVANPIRVMLGEHDRAGDLLAALRLAARDYVVPDDACASYRSLYARLEALEHDTHLHVHKESNVLFPAALREGSSR